MVENLENDSIVNKYGEEENKNEDSKVEEIKEDIKKNYVDKNSINKKVVAEDLYEKTRQMLVCVGGMCFLTFLCAAAGKNWYSIVMGALSIGWGAVFLVKIIQLRKYLNVAYNLK